MGLKKAFTIVELLIVIVVIAIIAAISIVAYSGTTQKATVSSIQADLTNAKKQLLAFQASSTTNSFPTAINCNNPSATEICLNASSGNSYSYSVYNSAVTPAFYLIESNGSNSYTITESTVTMAKSSIVTNGLIVYLDAADSTSYPGSGTVWTDISGNGNNGTLMNGVGYSSADSGALVFDKIDDYVQGNLNPNLATKTPFTTITWLNATSNSSEQHLTNLKPISQFYVRSGGLGTPSFGNLSGGTVNPNTWYMASMSYRPTGNSSIHLNDVQISSGILPTLGISSGYVIGNYVGGGNYWFGGRIAVSMIYKRALTASEIAQNFNALRGRYGI